MTPARRTRPRRTTDSHRVATPRRVAGTALVALFALSPLVAAACSDDGGTVEAKDATTTTASTTTVDPSESTTIPDLGGVAGPVGSCLSAAAKFTNLVQGVLEGGDGAKRSQEAAEQLKSELPADLQNDAQTIADKFGEIAARNGQLQDSDVNDPAYNSATQAIATYFSSTCKG